jgi:tetratricopeptide (TPR) repeat protein
MRAIMGVVLMLALVAGARADKNTSDATVRARALYQAGVLKYNLSEFQQALEDFKAAYELKPDPVLLFNIGQCHRMLGHPQEAVYAYRAYLREVPSSENREEVERLRVEMEKELQRKLEPTPPTGTLPPQETPPTVAAPAPAPTPSPAPAATTAPAAEHVSTPIYKRWWLWTAVGAVVVIAVGVGVGVGTASAPDAPNPGGTAGSLAVKF